MTDSLSKIGKFSEDISESLSKLDSERSPRKIPISKNSLKEDLEKLKREKYKFKEKIFIPLKKSRSSKDSEINRLSSSMNLKQSRKTHSKKKKFQNKAKFFKTGDKDLQSSQLAEKSKKQKNSFSQSKREKEAKHLIFSSLKNKLKKLDQKISRKKDLTSYSSVERKLMLRNRLKKI